MQNNQSTNINSRLKRKHQMKPQKNVSQLWKETMIIDSNQQPKRNENGELIITYEKLQDDILFDIDLSTLHSFGAKNMVLIQRASTPTKK